MADQSCQRGAYDPHVDVQIELRDRTDLATGIYRQLRRLVLDGELKPGDQVPPTRELADRLGVARATVVSAYERLRADGYLAARAGAGTFVSDAMAPASSWLRRAASHPATLQPRALWDDVPVPEATDEGPEFDFRRGIPDAAQFPYDVWRRLLGRELHAREVGAGAYGDPAGHGGLREAIARHVQASRGIKATADDITITNGTQQAVDLITRVLVDPGEQTALEDPGYLPPRRLFTSLGARVVSVPVDAEGLVVDAIPARTRLVYTTPSHQFPLGTSMSLRRRLALLEWAQVHDAAIIEDDYDSELIAESGPVEPLQPLDPHQRVLYVGSFSKTMLNTLRLGFVIAPPSLHRAIRAAKYVTDWHTSLPVQAALARFIDDGWYARHLRRMRGIYHERYEQIAEILHRDFAGVLDVIDGPGGLHLSALAPSHTSAQLDQVAVNALRSGVGVQPLSEFAADDTGPAGLVFGFGAVPSDRIGEGLRRLRAAFTAD